MSELNKITLKTNAANKITQPTQSISFSDVLSMFNDIIDSTFNTIDNDGNVGFKLHSESTAYKQGQAVIFSNNIYTAIANVNPGVFNPAEWNQLPTGGAVLSFLNGLTQSGNNVKLGGALTENTSLTGSNDFTIQLIESIIRNRVESAAGFVDQTQTETTFSRTASDNTDSSVFTQDKDGFTFTVGNYSITISDTFIKLSNGDNVIKLENGAIELKSDQGITLNNDSATSTQGVTLLSTNELNPNENGLITRGFLERSRGNLLNSGLISGGEVTITGNKTISIAAGSGVIIDKSDPENITLNPISWPAIPFYSLTSTLTTGLIKIFIDASGNISDVNKTNVTETNFINLIHLDVLFISNNVLQAKESNPANLGYETGAFNTFIRRVIGKATADGLVFLNNGANLQLQHTSGTVFDPAINYRNDSDQVALLSVPAASNFNISRLYRSTTTHGNKPGEILEGVSNVIDPGLWDDGSGTLQTVPSSDWTIQRLYWSPFGVKVAFGQEVFSNKNSALEALGKEDFQDFGDLDGSWLRGFLIVRDNTTDLSNINQAEFRPAPKFDIGRVTGGQTPTVSIPNAEDLLSADTNTQAVLSPDGAGGVQFRLLPSASTGGSTGALFYPLEVRTQDDFSTTPANLAVFVANGATVTYDSVNQRLDISNTSGAKGFKAPYVHVGGQDLTFTVDIVCPTNDCRVLSQHGTLIAENLGTGTHTFRFITPVSNPAFTREVRVTNSGFNDFSVNSYLLYETLPDDQSLVFTKEQTVDEVSSQLGKSLFFFVNNDFSKNDTYRLLDRDAATFTYDEANERLEVDLRSGGQFVIGFDASDSPRLDVPEYTYLYLDMEFLAGDSVEVRPVWTGPAQIINNPGNGTRFKTTLRLRKTFDIATNNLDYPVISDSNSTARFYVHSIALRQIPNFLEFNEPNKGLFGGTVGGNGLGYATGENALVTTDGGIAYGNNAKAINKQILGAFGGPQQVVMGDAATGATWRSTVIGADASNWGVSGTVVGAGNTGYNSHASVWGRGASDLPEDISDIDHGVVFNHMDIYGENCHSSFTHAGPGGVNSLGVGSLRTGLSSSELLIHGANSKDARRQGWNSATAYNIYDIVVQNLEVYTCILAHTNQDPAADVPGTPDANGDRVGTYWKYWYTLASGQGVRGDGSFTDQTGGAVGLEAGKGSGGNHGGPVRFYSSRATGSEVSNELAPRFLILELKPDSTTGTGVFVVDPSNINGARLEIKVGASGTGPGGVGRMIYID